MTIYENVKAAVTVRQAAEHYGLQVGRNSMTCCPFHHDRHPSLKLYEDHFYCFGCGATGDVIDFTARLFEISPFEAVKKLAADFGIDTDKPPTATAMVKPKYPMIKAFREDELYCHRVLCDYLHLLESWKVQFAPKTPENIGAPAETQRSGFGGERTNSGMDETSPTGGGEGYEACEDEDDRFTEALQMHDFIEYLTDVLTVGELEERVETVEILLKDGKVQELEARMERIKEEQENGRAV